MSTPTLYGKKGLEQRCVDQFTNSGIVIKATDDNVADVLKAYTADNLPVPSLNTAESWHIVSNFTSEYSPVEPVNFSDCKSAFECVRKEASGVMQTMMDIINEDVIEELSILITDIMVEQFSFDNKIWQPVSVALQGHSIIYNSEPSWFTRVETSFESSPLRVYYKEKLAAIRLYNLSLVFKLEPVTDE